MQAVVSCLCADPRSAWELTGQQGEREAAHPRLHPASQLDPVYIYRFTRKGGRQAQVHIFIGFLLGKATGFSAKHFCHLNKRELTVVQHPGISA